jgi:hypothetical protein
MPIYKLANGETVDTTGYTEDELIVFKITNPGATVSDDFQNGLSKGDAVAGPINPSSAPSRANMIAGIMPPSGESALEDGSSVYGEYLDEDGNLQFKETPYEVQLDNYKQSYNDIMNATGMYESFGNLSIEERKKYAQDRVQVPKLTREVYNRDTDKYDVIATKDAKELFAKNLPTNFKDFDNADQFNTALEAGIVNTLGQNPVIQNELDRTLEQAKPALDKILLDLQKKYDTTDPVGLAIAEQEYKQAYKELALDPVTNSAVYKKTIQELSVAAGDVSQELSKAFGRYDSVFLSSIDALKKYGIFDTALEATESIYKGVNNIAQAGRQTLLSAEQTGLEKTSKEINSLLAGIDSGDIKDTDPAYFGGVRDPETGAMYGEKKGTVKDKLAYLNKANSAIEVEILNSLKNISEGQKYISLFSSADLSDGVDFTDIIRTVGEMTPQMGLTVAGTLTGNPILTGLGTATMFMQEYGSNYYTALEEGVRKDNKDFDSLPEEARKKLLLEALREGKYASQAESAGWAVLSTLLERAGTTRIAKAASRAVGMGSDFKNAMGSLYRGEVKKVLTNAINSGARSVKGGVAEFLTETSQSIISQVSTGSQLDTGLGSYIKLNEAFEEGKAGAIVGAVIPGAAAIGRQTLVEVRNTARDIATRFDLSSNLKSVNNFFSKAEENLKEKLTTNQITKLEYDIELEQLNEARNIGFKIPKNFNEKSKKKIFDIMVKKNTLENEIKGKEKALVEKEIEEIKNLNGQLGAISATEKKVINTIKAGKSVDVELIPAENNAEVQRIAKEKNMDVGNDSNTTGYNSEDGKIIIIDMERAAKFGEVNTAAHEMLHKVLFNTLYKMENDGTIEGKNVVRGLSAALKSEINKLNPEFLKDSEFAERIKLYKKYPNSVRAEEVLTLFSDALAKGEITYDEGVFTPLIDFFRQLFQSWGWKEIKFNNGKDVFNFIKDYNKSIDKGKFGAGITKVANEGAVVGEGIKRFTGKENLVSSAKQSQSLAGKKPTVLDAINNLAAEDVKTKQDFQKPRVFNKVYNATLDGGPISNYVKSKSTSTEMYENTMDSIRDRLMNYDPAKDRKTKSGKPITFGEFIFSNTPFALADARKKLAIEAEKNKKETSVDTKEAVQIAAPESSSETIQDKPKYRKIKDSNVLPGETLDAIKNKVLKTVRVLKSKINEGVSINKTVSPVVAEIKKEMGKQADIDFKKAMGGKKDNKLRSFLIKNKKVILSNMTTTWLMQAMPGAVQKQVDGKWTSDWAGKKIDREKVTTQLAGRTSGAEMVRRLPNAVNNLSDADFLGYIVDKSGAPIRGRKESLAKAMAEEVSLELFEDAIADPDSNIRKAFEDNQGALGVVIAENIDSEVTRQVERGNVKFSKGLGALNKSKRAKWEKGKPEFFDEIYKMNGSYNEKDLLQAHRDVYGSSFEEAEHASIAQQFAKPLNIFKIEEDSASTIPDKEISDLLQDIANDIDGGIVIQLMTGANKTVSKLYEKWPNVLKARAAVTNGLAESNNKLTKWEENKKQFFDKLSGLNVPYTEKNILKAHKDVYGDTFTNAEHADISNRFLNSLNNSKVTKNSLQNALNNVNPGFVDAQAAVAFMRSTFGNSGRIGKWKWLKIDKDATNRADLYSSKRQIINALNQAGYDIKNITRTEIEFNDGRVEKRKYSSSVSVAKKYLGSFDVKAEKENAAAAMNFTTAILNGLKNESPNIQAVVLSAMNSGTNTALRAAAPVLGRTTVLPSKNTKDYTPEHNPPARVALLYMYNSIVKGDKSIDLDALKKDYRINIVPKSMDKVLTANKIRQVMLPGYIPGVTNPNSRYFNFVTRGRIQFALKNLEDGTVEGQSYADYYKEKNKPVVNQRPTKKSISLPIDDNKKILSKEFNSMIERQKGVESYKEFSKAVAEIRGKKVGKYKFFISPAAEDFRGLTQYVFAGKGKQGEADQKFFEDNLMTPYFEGVGILESERQAVLDDVKGLLKMFKPVKKKINKFIEGDNYTYDAAIRIYLWNKAGIEIPGLSKRDQKRLNQLIVDDVELSGFAEALLAVSRQDAWPNPSEYWLAQTTLSDLNRLTERTNRKKYLSEFIENVDTIFSEVNLNKVEAFYGKPTRLAIENSISSMKSGSNSPTQNDGDVITSRWNNWVNSSIGTIMFFNRRSAILQTLSATNFINWSDNNPLKAGLAFANQPQYWKDFAMIFNSDKLKQRRGGLKSDVQESEIANAAKNSKDKAQAVISYILKIGFTPTQIADSFAISLGGASLYRNRVNTYKKQGLTEKEAESKAFSDFSKLSDEAQQSGDPALVSQQQRSIAGRLVLSFQNTTMQYTRKMKKAAQNLKNGRGDAKTHISQIIYYGAVQNFIFQALSNSLFALIPGFDEEEEEEKAAEKELKVSRIMHGMTDSVLRGTGIYGAVISTLKNTIIKAVGETQKGFKGDGTAVVLEAANIAPAIGSKLKKIYSAYKTYQFDEDIIRNYPLNVNMLGKFNPSPTYNIIGNLSSALLNVPLDRAISEARTLSEILDSRNTKFQRIALGLGWRTWDVNSKNEEGDLIKTIVKLKRKQEKEAKKREDKRILKLLTK